MTIFYLNNRIRDLNKKKQTCTLESKKSIRLKKIGRAEDERMAYGFSSAIFSSAFTEHSARSIYSKFIILSTSSLTAPLLTILEQVLGRISMICVKHIVAYTNNNLRIVSKWVTHNIRKGFFF